MWKLLRAELYRTLHRRDFYLMFLVVGMLFFFFYSGLGCVIRSKIIFDWMENAPSNLKECAAVLQLRLGLTMDDFSSVNGLVERYLLYIFGGEILSEINPFPFFSLFLSTLLIGMDFKKRTINDSMYQGYSRLQIFLAKTLHYYIVAITVSLFWLLLYLWYIYGMRGFIILTVPYMIRCISIWLYITIGTFSAPLLIAYICRDIFKSILVNLAWFLSTSILSWIEIPQMIRQIYNPLFLARSWETIWASNIQYSLEKWMPLLILPIITAGSVICISYFLFRKAELK